VTQTSAKGYVDMQKHFFPGDTGVTVCNYPNGKLKNGMRYENLVSSGFTSPVIAGMCLDRNMSGALEIAGNLRQRHDGRHRSCAGRFHLGGGPFWLRFTYVAPVLVKKY
jgi:hypothetical protein